MAVAHAPIMCDVQSALDRALVRAKRIAALDAAGAEQVDPPDGDHRDPSQSHG